MKDINIDEFLRVLEEHKQLFNILGYELDIKDAEIPLHTNICIMKNDKIVGTLIHKDKNMYWLKENKEILVNENINNMNFHKVPKYNKKPVFHIMMSDRKFRCNCYNMFNKNYIGIENKKFKIKKFNDKIKIEIKATEQYEEFTINYPNRIDNNEDYTIITNKIFGYDIISNIESYYSKNKIKVKK